MGDEHEGVEGVDDEEDEDGVIRKNWGILPPELEKEEDITRKEAERKAREEGETALREKADAQEEEGERQADDWQTTLFSKSTPSISAI